jgi:hypothetical protein
MNQFSYAVKWTDRSPLLQPGEVITGCVRNGIEDRQALGKMRLVVVVNVPKLGCLNVIGLTCREMTKSGDTRMEIFDNQEWGWHGRSFVFGRRLTRLARIDLGDHVGWISDLDGESLARMFGLAENWMSNGMPDGPH